jgi:hypothetical protein
MLQLLRDLASDMREACDIENPLRQVLITTHSPAVVAQVPDDSLLFAQRADRVTDAGQSSIIFFRHLPRTWRDQASPTGPTIQRGQIVSYLNPVRDTDTRMQDDLGFKRVVDTVGIQHKLW